jgi:translation initiation factor IF-3
MNFTPTREGPRINDEIGGIRVRLVDEKGQMVGVVGRSEALTMAATAGLDLVEIAPNADPPVCKILDYGKFKYEEQKKRTKPAKKAQRSSRSRKSSCARASTTTITRSSGAA